MSKRSILIVSDSTTPEVRRVVRALRKRRERVFCLDTAKFGSDRTAITLREDGTGILSNGDEVVDVKSIKSVWYTPLFAPAPNLKDPEERAFAKEELKGLLENLYPLLSSAYWMNNVYAVHRADNKVLQLSEAQRVGISVPETCVTNSSVAAAAFMDELDGEVIYKPIRFPYFLPEYDRKSESPIIPVIPTSVVRPEHRRNLKSITKTGGIFQPLLDKEYELRVTIVGSEIFAVRIDSQVNAEALGRTDWRRGEISKRTLSRYRLPSHLARKCLRLMKNLSLSYGAMDFIKTKSGKYVFLEVNCNGSFNWVEHVTRSPVSERIALVLSNPGRALFKSSL